MAKYLYNLLILIVSAEISSAQAYNIYKPLKVDIGFGIADEPLQSGGFLMYLEPSYTFANIYKTGIRLEDAVIFNMKQIGSYALTFDYYLPAPKNFRFFVGAGYSYFNTTTMGGCDPGPTTLKTVSRTGSSGLFVRTGLELFHFRLGIEYNLVPSTYVAMTNIIGQTVSTATYKNAYLGIKAGLCLGGGKKNR